MKTKFSRSARCTGRSYEYHGATSNIVLSLGNCSVSLVFCIVYREVHALALGWWPIDHDHDQWSADSPSQSIKVHGAGTGSGEIRWPRREQEPHKLILPL